MVSELMRALKDGASVPMPLKASTIGRRETEGYLHPGETPRPVKYALGRLYLAMKKAGGHAPTRCYALALALANETAKLTDAEYRELREGLLAALDEGREAARNM